MHIKRYAGLIANYTGEYKCQKCEEEGNQVKTEEGKCLINSEWDSIIKNIIPLRVSERRYIVTKAHEPDKMLSWRDPELLFSVQSHCYAIRASADRFVPQERFVSQQIQKCSSTGPGWAQPNSPPSPPTQLPPRIASPLPRAPFANPCGRTPPKDTAEFDVPTIRAADHMCRCRCRCQRRIGKTGGVLPLLSYRRRLFL